MVKYHINDKMEVRRCTAKHNCRFGGADGKQDHFHNKEEALDLARERLAKKFGPFSGFKKSDLKPLKDNTAAGLKKMSDRGFRVSAVKKVEDHEFDGNPEDLDVSNVDVLDEENGKQLLEKLLSNRE